MCGPCDLQFFGLVGLEFWPRRVRSAPLLKHCFAVSYRVPVSANRTLFCRGPPLRGGQSLVLRNAVFGNSDAVMGTGVGNVVTSGTWNGKAG